MAKRQFLWIMSDTTRFDMLGCYGNPAMQTPCLDAMAAEGLRFERAYTTQPVCGPARSSLFTGQFPHSNGSWGNSMPLGADVKTLGQRLSAQGIRCAYIGKWHLDGGDYFGNGVCPDGWCPEYWYDMKCYLDELSDEDKVRSRIPGSALEGEGVEASFTFGHRVTQRALDFLEKHGDEDFFLVVSYDEPHGPFLCPPEYVRLHAGAHWPLSPAHADDLADKPELQRLWAGNWKPDPEAKEGPGCGLFLSCNSFMDSLAGTVLDKALVCAPEALTLFTSDHGDGLREHGLTAKGPAVYDNIARIPLILRGPGVVRGVCPHAISHIDLPATVMDHMGLPIPKCFEGQSLLPVLKDPALLAGRPAFVEFNRYEIDHDGFGGFQPMRAIVTDRYKLVLHVLDTDELYDVEKDPYDIKNLIDDPAYAVVRDALHDQLLEWMNATRDPFRGYQWACRPWRKDKQATWAVDGYTRQRENEPGEYRQRDYNTGLTMEQAVRKK